MTWRHNTLLLNSCQKWTGVTKMKHSSHIWGDVLSGSFPVGWRGIKLKLFTDIVLFPHLEELCTVTVIMMVNKTVLQFRFQTLTEVSLLPKLWIYSWWLDTRLNKKLQFNPSPALQTFTEQLNKTKGPFWKPQRIAGVTKTSTPLNSHMHPWPSHLLYALRTHGQLYLAP